MAVNIYVITLTSANAKWNVLWGKDARLLQPRTVSNSPKQQGALATARRRPESRTPPGCTSPHVEAWSPPPPPPTPPHPFPGKRMGQGPTAFTCDELKSPEQDPLHLPGEVNSVCLMVACLLNVPGTRECISWTDLLGQFYVLPH